MTESGKKREVYDGNLITQHRNLLRKLEAAEANPILKVKKRRQHEEQPAYPPRALVELLVNTLVHRDYEIPEPALIEIRPGEEIVFNNPGGLTQKLAGTVVVRRVFRHECNGESGHGSHGCDRVDAPMRRHVGLLSSPEGGPFRGAYHPAAGFGRFTHNRAFHNTHRHVRPQCDSVRRRA